MSKREFWVRILVKRRHLKIKGIYLPRKSFKAEGHLSCVISCSDYVFSEYGLCVCNRRYLCCRHTFSPKGKALRDIIAQAQIKLLPGKILTVLQLTKTTVSALWNSSNNSQGLIIENTLVVKHTISGLATSVNNLKVFSNLLFQMFCLIVFSVLSPLL